MEAPTQYYGLIPFSDGNTAIGIFNGPECDSSQFVDYYEMYTDAEAQKAIKKLNKEN